MFFDGYSKPRRRRFRTLDDFGQGILNAVMAVVCLFFKGAWVFTVIFALCSAFRFWHHFKMKKNKAALKKIEKEYGDDEEDEDEDDDLEEVHLSRKERKARYKETLSKIEEEFPDFDIDEDEDD